MADRHEHAAAFDELVGLLHGAASANAHLIAVHRGTERGDAASRRMEDALDRLSLLYATGTYENLAIDSLFQAAIENELVLAHDILPGDDAAGDGHRLRARALVDCARSGFRINLRPVTQVTIHRAVHVAPADPAFEQGLRRRRAPYLRWDDGVVVVLEEHEILSLAEAGMTVHVLFLNADGFLDLVRRQDTPAMGRELDRRLALARQAADGLGDCRHHHRRLSLLSQSTLLRGLRDRLEGDHPGAHATIQPILAGNRAVLEATVVSAPIAADATRQDHAAAAMDHARAVRSLITRLAASPDDPAGFRARFRAAAAGLTDAAPVGI
jgi:hypothetical protein